MSKQKPGKYIVIDTETTGLSPRIHGLIQVGALALDTNLNIIDEYIEDINPPEGTVMDEEASKIHNISIERIQKGLKYKQFCQSFLAFIKKNFTEPPIAIGQFYPFDYAYLEDVFGQCDYQKVMSQKILTNKFIDTKSLVLALNLYASLNKKSEPFPVTSLSKPGGLAEKFNLTDTYKAHDALGDCKATRLVLIELLKTLPDLLK